LSGNENSLHAIRLELDGEAAHSGRCRIAAVVGDVTDERSVSAALARHRPEIVFHAAAHKHVPLMEENPCEAVKNNVRGTRMWPRRLNAQGVGRFIMISTDKAANPTTIMGASKRVAETNWSCRRRPGAGRRTRSFASATCWAVTAAWCRISPSKSGAVGRSP
jgi:FlaA1/EpsC-like NDP-sugar epimerase